MNRTSRLLALLAVLGCVATGIAVMGAEPTRAERWQRVDKAVRNGLPRTAVKELDSIIASALKDKAYPEAIKAVGKKVVLEAGGPYAHLIPEEKISRMRAVIPTMPAEMHPVLHVLLGHWYYEYCEQNKHRIAQRSSAGETTGPDVTTWDVPRILAEVDRQFETALAHEKELQATPVAAYASLLSPGSIPDAYRPTLFDVLAFDALKFHALADQYSGPEVEDAFEFTGDSPAFAPVDEFLKWQPKTTDTTSRSLKAVRLYQKLLAFHQPDADQSALFDADLYRLRFAFNSAVGEKRTEAYLTALSRFVDAHQGHEISALARHRWAGVLKSDDELVKARAVALAGAKAFPKSPGGKLCDNLVREIEAKTSMISTERVWADARPEIHLTYANLTKVYFRLLKADYVTELKTGRAGCADPESKEALLKQKPTVEFSYDLPPTLDYRERMETIPGPKSLPPGFYYLIASHTADFGVDDNVVTFTTLWVSDLAIVSPMFGALRVEGLVLDGKSGEPIPGAKVQLWGRKDANGMWTAAPVATTDRNGRYSLPGRVDHEYVAVVTHQNQALASSSFVRAPDETPQAEEYSAFFTDRALYRPGQTIRFKGISFRADRNRDEYTTIANRNIIVEFTDANGKEIARHLTRTNEYGSFSGTFVAPRDRLTGQMQIRVIGGPPGATPISVEEYKRPTFVVALDGPKGPVKLGAEVRVPGKATAYTGAPVGRAKVQYRVVREVRYPAWFFEYARWRSNVWADSQEIAHGVITSEADGTFSIPFFARPDPAVPEKFDPSFEYTLTADVTDTTGETRTGTGTVEIGYTALRATVAAAEWQTADKDVKLTVSTTTLDGLGQSAKGVLKIHRLKEPAAVVRPGIYDDLEESPFPSSHRTKPKPTWPVSWAAGDVVRSVEFTTDATGKAEVRAKLPAGIYRAGVESTDGFGKPVTGKTDVRVLDPSADRLNITVPNIVSAPSWRVEPGGEFTLFWGTGYESGRAFLEVEHRGKVTQAFWTEPGKTQATLKVPVTEAMRGGFTVRVTFVHENRAYLTSRRVEVPWTNKELTVRWETFRSKLEPGKKETFTAVVTGPDARRAVAEMVATLYDQSLDAHLPHDWLHLLDVFRRDEPHNRSEFANSLHLFWHLHGGWSEPGGDFPPHYRSLPEDLIRDQTLLGIVGDTGEGIRRGSGGRLFGSGFAGGGRIPGGGFLGGNGFGGMGGGMMGFGGGFGGGGLGNPFFGGMKMPGAGDPTGAPRTANTPRDHRTDLNTVTARKNLAETAFFFPHLVSDAEGVVRMEFTMPEALTRWKFLGFAHDKELRSGFLTDEIVTAKDLMA
ncbi:MAG: hypothetical protein JWO38_6986, partial [Gemmataceae bacterium]|nr:hypothetical protein [Gemmataceae bacterium]